MKILFVCFLTLVSSISYCQIPKPVKWSFGIEVKNEGSAQFKAVAKIEKGWNIYSVYMSDEGPIPTAFDFEKLVGGALEGKVIEVSHAIKSVDPLFDIEVIKFKDEAIFTQAIKGGKGLKLEGTVVYMCCDSNRCLPPTTEVFNLSL
jgi:hypothetical protein